ncbi:hypothetical protein JTE90_022381 [Oedothorax gibbosus]|uniref:Uncharacterized protein n=1 Tax=Oedothorax gibbosus TaxID=931172 RepID=A0AAV6UPE0_9ARAC|nr:hypothetical protein JTE90_022381 [Oedothorax gibbosus]
MSPSKEQNRQHQTQQPGLLRQMKSFDAVPSNIQQMISTSWPRAISSRSFLARVSEYPVFFKRSRHINEHVQISSPVYGNGFFTPMGLSGVDKAPTFPMNLGPFSRVPPAGSHSYSETSSCTNGQFTDDYLFEYGRMRIRGFVFPFTKEVWLESFAEVSSEVKNFQSFGLVER